MAKNKPTPKPKYETLEDVPEPIERRMQLPDSYDWDATDDKLTMAEKRALNIRQSEADDAMSHILQYKHPDWKPGETGNPFNKNRSKKRKSSIRNVGLMIAEASAQYAMSPKQKRLAQKIGLNPEEMNIIEALMMNLATSANPNKVALFLERTYGKVPNINITAQYNEELVQRFRSKLTDGELEAIAGGADVLEILLSKLPDVEDDNTIDAETKDI